jgi:hypothetical protein
MSAVTTFKVSVYGDSFEELQDKAEDEIASLLQIDLEDVSQKANYELLVSRDDDMGADFTYKAEVIARIRHERR